MVYGLQLIGLLDLSLHPASKQFSSDAELRAKEIQKLYEDVRKKIEKTELEVYRAS